MDALDDKRLKVIIGLSIIFILLAIGSALTKRPWSDEAWFASPALNLLTKGSMGTSVLEPLAVKGINLYTYWIMPLYLVTQAGWYFIFGFGLLQMRIYSAMWGLVALISWFLIMKRLAKNETVALLTFALLALDYAFIEGASFGRMDMMCAALGFAGYAVYLHLRERNLTLAVLLSQSLVAAAGLTHPIGILEFAGLLFLTLYFDRTRLKFRLLGVAAIPYLIGAIGWGLYIMKAPALFIEQFAGNIRTGHRLTGFAAPWKGFADEITRRYMVAYGFGGHAAEHSGPIKLKALVLVAYLIALVGALCVRDIRQHKGYRALLILITLNFVILSILDGQKLSYYLVHLVPLYTAALAIWIQWCWSRRAAPRPIIALCVCGLLCLQLGGVIYRIRLNTYAKSFAPAAEFVKTHANKDSLIMGSAELGFELGFRDNLIDDVQLGFHSGKKPDIIVVDESYEEAFAGYREFAPELYQHINHLLTEEFQEVYNQASYRVYMRR